MAFRSERLLHTAVLQKNSHGELPLDMRVVCAYHVQTMLQGTNFGPRKRRVPHRPIPRSSSWAAFARGTSVRDAPATQKLHARSLTCKGLQ